MEIIEKAIKAQEIYEKLKESQNMCDIGETIDSLTEEMAKLVLKKAIYDRKE